MRIYNLYETLIDEAMLGINSLPETTGLFYTEVNGGGVELELYDPKSKTIFATISASGYKGEPINYVNGVAAIKGFGPLIYEMAMMQSKLNGKTLAPQEDGDVRGDAFNVWEKFYDRGDVDKITRKLLDDDFNFQILDGQKYEYTDEEKKERWFEESDDMRYGLLVFNSQYSMEPNETFRILRKRAENAISNGFDPQIPQDVGSKLWEEMYE